MRIEDPVDLDWYLDHVVVPSDIDRRPVGPVRAWQASWVSADHRLATVSDRGAAARVAQLARQQGFVVTRAQALAAGFTPADVRRSTARGEWQRHGHGVLAIGYVDAASDTFRTARVAHALVTAGTVLRKPGHLAASASAAVLHGLPVMQVPVFPELVVRAPSTTGHRPGAHVRRAALTDRDIDSWFGARTTTVARTIVDLARADPRSGLMAADAALHESIVSAVELRQVIDSSTGLPGIRRAREVLALADGLIESPLESITHLALHDGRFPPPKLQWWLRGSDGRRYRVDFFWPQFNVVLEADGRGKYADDALWTEKKRELALTRAGYQVERVVWSEIVDTWPATAAWFRSFLAQTR